MWFSLLALLAPAGGPGFLSFHRPAIFTLPAGRSCNGGHSVAFGGVSDMASLTDSDWVRLVRLYRSDLRAAFADLLGYTVLSPDQERGLDVLSSQSRVSFCGGTGTGKSFILGGATAILTALWPQSKALFGGPKLEQASRLSWLEFQRAHDRARERGLPLGGQLGSYEWRGARDWFAVCMALSDRNNAAGVKGMMHAAGGVWVVLEELEGVAPEVRDALDAGTTQENAHFWTAFNPVDPTDAAGQFWAGTPEVGRVRFSALACAEWQERTGIRIPGMPTLAALRQKWGGRENEPLYYTNVLGEFPPESHQWVVVPRDWFDRCTGVAPAGVAQVGIGVDTAGGRAENVIAVADHGRVIVAWCSRDLHQTPRIVTECKRIAEQYGGRKVPIAVDVVGQGGKGVADQLRADGYNALDFIGGGREFAGKRDVAELTADCATWAWWSLREAVAATIEGRAAAICLPADPLLREQLARRYSVVAERRYKLETKDAANSPDRADAVAMAWLAALVGRRTGGHIAWV